MTGSVLPGRTLRAAALAFVPEASAMAPDEWASFMGVIEQVLSERPAAVRRQLSLFLRALDVLSFVRTGRRFASLSVERRGELLGGLERGRVLLLRRGVWGLRTIVFMGYYARAGAGSMIGYHADARGWEARR